MHASELTPIATEIVQQGYAKIAETFAGTTDRILADGYLIMRHLPYRRVLLERHHKPGCPFCRERATDFLIERYYHGLLLSQNLGPYAPCSLILRSRGHHTQAETTDFMETHGAALLHDLPHNTTLFSNQLAGNSQVHFHLQYLGELLPIAQLTRTHAPFNLTWQSSIYPDVQWVFLDGSDTTLNPSAHPIQHFFGLLLRGSASGIAAAVTTYFRHAEKLGMPYFNFSVWRDPDTECLYFFLTLRASNTLHTRHPKFPILIGSLVLSGIIPDGRSATEFSGFDYTLFCEVLRSKALPAEQHLQAVTALLKTPTKHTTHPP